MNVVVARTADEVRALRPVWERVQHHPNADIDFFLMILETRPGVCGPYVVEILDGEKPVALFACRIDEKKLPCKVGYTTVAAPKLRVLSLLRGGMMGEQSPAIARELLQALADALRTGVADAVYLSHMPEGSAVAAAAQELELPVRRDAFTDVGSHWRMTLPATADEFYERLPYKRRHELKRKIRQMAKVHNQDVVLRCIRAPADVPKMLADMATISAGTYQAAMGVGFELNDENRRRMELAASKGWLRTYMLHVEGKPCSYYMGTLYREWLYLDFTGYDPAFHREEPGNVLYARMVEDLCAQKDDVVKGLDYGPGDSVFKQRFGDVKDREISLYLFAPNGRGLRVHLLRAVTGLVDRVARRVSRGLNVEGRVKTWWRTQFRKRAQAKGKEGTDAGHDTGG